MLCKVFLGSSAFGRASLNACNWLLINDCQNKSEQLCCAMSLKEPNQWLMIFVPEEVRQKSAGSISSRCARKDPAELKLHPINRQCSGAAGKGPFPFCSGTDANTLQASVPAHPLGLTQFGEKGI